MFFRDKKKITYYNIYISFFVIVLPLISFTFYQIIIGILLSIFQCHKFNLFSTKDSILKCYNGFEFYFEFALAIICICIITCFSYITILIFYKPNFIIEENDILKKTSSIPDLLLFINKIIHIIFFAIGGDESTQWFVLFTLFILAFINMISFFHYNNYENIILMKFNKGLSLILFWNICCLVIGKVFQSWEFDGTLHLFCFGSILIIIYFIYYKEKINEFYNIDFKQIDSSKERLNYIKDFLDLIKLKDKCRKNYIIFNTLVLLREENCINKNCKMKKYLKMKEKGYQSDFIIYQYCQTLFELSIKKFPNDIILKANYIIYLVVQMSKKKLAQKLLETMKTKFLDFQNNYIIFCCKKYIESYTPGLKKNFEEHNKNIMRTIEYEKVYNIFKDNLSKVASLYYEFWSSLHKSHLQGTEDFIKLNDIGEKINSLIDKIDENFNILHNVKGDDLRVLNLYSGFLKNIRYASLIFLLF